MIVKSTLLVVILLLGSLAVAEAQSYVSSGVAGPQTVLGWNFAHAANCVVHYDGVTTWLYFFPQEGGYGYTNNPGFGLILAPACQTGNLIAVFVYSLDPLLWNQVLTYTFQ